MTHFRNWVKSGTPWIWLISGGVSISLLMVFGVLALSAARGLVYFWPQDIAEIRYHIEGGQEQRLIGQIQDHETVLTSRIKEAGISISTPDDQVTRYLLKTGNRDISGSDFGWILEPFIVTRSNPEALTVIERQEWGNLYGYLREVKENGTVIAEGEHAWDKFQDKIERVVEINETIRKIEKNKIGAINYQLEKLRFAEKRLDVDNSDEPLQRTSIIEQRHLLKNEYNELEVELQALYKSLNRDSYTLETMDGKLVTMPIAKIVRAFQPNSMNLIEKLIHYSVKLWEFVSDDPREANTEGGIFPAIFGTVLMVIIMSIVVTPLGVIAAIYLHEYAKQGPLTRTIRIAVNNLAGVPSIVYGLFGLGFFVYFLGGNIDQLFYSEALPSPTFGTGGIMWASLTLALLTLPVVIVATEEGLSRIPRSIREGSLALGATKAETLWRTVIPMASPAIMTGLILAVARAAGEVAPLMLVGVVKLAPSMPLDANFPFLHLDRKFMHLGFHIFDVGFQSPNVEAARPLVYATALLLFLIIVVLNLASISIRNRLREKYRNLEG